MKKALVFNIRIKGLEDKLWRKVMVSKSFTLSDLIYFILASFDLYYIQYYRVKIGNKVYDSVKEMYGTDSYSSVIGLKLKDIDFNSVKEIILEYNPRCLVEFVIEYIKEEFTKEDLPKLLDGFGKGAIEYVSTEELKSIIEETDRLGKSSYSTSILIDDEEEEEVFDYRVFDLKTNNMLSYSNYKEVKNGYEEFTLYDVLRITNESRNFFYKSDIRQIVSPFDYKKKYYPSNINELSDEELRNLHIPSNKDLNIYLLPSYKDLSHKNIMSMFTKESVSDKEERKGLFYVLRNNNYLFKFYDVLRKYGLFNDYLLYSEDYYKDILKEWFEENDLL